MINAMRSVSRFLPRAAAMTILGMQTVFAQQSEEVVVTATKRETTLQETPLSVTAFSRFELQRSGATGIFDYGTKVPNLGFSNEADGRFNSGSQAIRGVASGGVIGATGFYLDDIPVPEYMDPRVIDLERVEILRGPQGTLYGAQSMGGTVRLVTTPADRETSVVDTHANVSGTKNGGLNWAVDASVNVPIIEGILGVRGSLFYVEESGYFDRAILPASPGPSFGKIDDVNEDVTYGGQIDLTWKVGSNLEIRPRFMYQRTEADGMPLADIDPDNFVNNRNFNINEDGENEWWLAAVTFNLDTTIGTIVSTTAKFNREVFESEDGTEFWPAVFGFPAVPWRFSGGEDDESVVHETRLVSDYGELGWERLAATVGVFYEDRTHVRFFPESFLSGLNQNFTALLNAGGAGIPFPPGALASDLVFSNRKKRLRTFDLFCGAGGSSRGAVMAGATPVAGLDLWELATDTYKLNFPHAVTYRMKASSLPSQRLVDEVGEIDLLLASPECTNHSIARGNRPRCDNSRNTAFEVIRFARILRPRWVVVENVLPMKYWERFDEWHNKLKAIGYKTDVGILDAQYHDTPQSRCRLFIVGDLEAKPSLPERGPRTARTVASVIGTGEPENRPWRFSPVKKPTRAKATVNRAERAIEALGEVPPVSG